MTESQVDRRPKHVQVREYVRNLIHDLPPGAPAPSERELTQQFGIARMTVRHALDMLVAQGLLERSPGRGTFVAKPHIDMQARLSSFSEEMDRRGRVPGARTLLRRRETAGPGVARALDLSGGAPIVHWRRVRTADSEPICIIDSYVPFESFPELVDIPEPASLFGWFGTQGKMPTWGEDSVVADLATDEEADLLGIARGSAVLRLSRRAFCRELAVEVSRSVYRADRFTLWIPVLRAEFER